MINFLLNTCLFYLFVVCITFSFSVIFCFFPIFGAALLLILSWAFIFVNLIRNQHLIKIKNFTFSYHTWLHCCLWTGLHCFLYAVEHLGTLIWAHSCVSVSMYLVSQMTCCSVLQATDCEAEAGGCSDGMELWPPPLWPYWGADRRGLTVHNI